MKTLSFWKKSLYSALIFFGTLIALSVWYTLVGNLSTVDKVSTGSVLSSASWNRIVDGVLDLDSRLSHFSFAGGNVGIGTISPNALLHLKLNVNDNGAAYNQGLLFETNSNKASGIWADQKSWGFGELVFGTNNAGVSGTPTERMRIDRTGNIGIGTATPGAKLDVAGDIKASAGGTIGVTKISGTWGPGTANIPNNTFTYIGDTITLTPGNWIVYYDTFYDNDATSFSTTTYNHPCISTTNTSAGIFSCGNLETCGPSYCPINQTYQVDNVANTTTYYVIHYINGYGGSYVRIRSGWGNFYAIKVN